MAIERFLRELGTPHQLKPAGAPPEPENPEPVIKPVDPEPVLKPEVQTKRNDEKLEKSIKDIGEKISLVEGSIQTLQSNADLRDKEAKSAASRISGIEADLKKIRTIQRELLQYQEQVKQYIAAAEQQRRLCPNCSADVDWPNLRPKEGMFSWLDGYVYRICPECGHRARTKRKE